MYTFWVWVATLELALLFGLATGVFPPVFFYNSIASRNVCYLVLLLPTYISIAEWALYWFLPGFVGEATGIIWAGFCVHYMSVNILVSSIQS